MAIALGKIQIGAYTFVRNPEVEDIDAELLISHSQSINGTTVSSYIPKTGDDTKVKRKKAFSISGIDPDIDQIEAIALILEDAPPLAFVDVLGNTYSVVVTSDLKQNISASKYKTRSYSFSLKEI